jgi:hypothetical protein
MSVQFKISITKDIIHQSKNCGIDNDLYKMGTDCAVAVALQDIFPQVYVTNFYIFPFGIENNEVKHLKIALPLVAQQFVKLFDGFWFAPNLRLMLPEFQFTVDVPNEIINVIDIDEVKEIISNKQRLNLSCGAGVTKFTT